MRRRDPFEPLATTRKKKSDPFPFVLDELASLDPRTRPMFGCLAVYVGERIVMILRDKTPSDPDNGVWLSFTPEHEASLREAFPALEPIAIFQDKVAGWKNLSSRSPTFEEDVLRACELIKRGDDRIGKVPGARKPKAQRAPAQGAPEAPMKRAPETPKKQKARQPASPAAKRRR